MKSELNLFIIWEKASELKERIIEDIDKKFDILDVYNIEWDKSKFSENLTRFYGQKLPKNSFKEKHCGNGPFTLIVVNDTNPRYEERQTSREIEVVNKNMFDSKQLYRDWTGGGHKIHGTNSEVETNHDLTLLLGCNVVDYINEKKGLWDGNIKNLKTNIIAADGWKDLNELFYVLNATCEYVVLRNFEYLPDKFNCTEHQDIDLLVRNYSDVKYILNATAVTNKKYRVLNKVKIAREEVIFDFRYLDDKYYDEKWQKDILETRIMDNKGFYKPNEENLLYSIIYHGLIHKKSLAKDYEEKIIRIVKDKEEWNEFCITKKINILKKKLDSFMVSKNYTYTEPIDISVYYNIDLLEENNIDKISIKRKLNLIKTKCKYFIKKVVSSK